MTIDGADIVNEMKLGSNSGTFTDDAFVAQL